MTTLWTGLIGGGSDPKGSGNSAKRLSRIDGILDESYVVGINRKTLNSFNCSGDTSPEG